MPIGLNNNVDEINKFVIDSILNLAEKTIPIYKPNNSRHKTLPKYILELIKLRKKRKIS